MGRHLTVLDLKKSCRTLSTSVRWTKTIGPFYDPVTWYKIKYTGEQVAQWDFQNNAILTSPPGPVFVLEVPLRNLLTSTCNFIPCDRTVQRAYLSGLAHASTKRPFARSGHIARNKLHWDANYAVGLSKQKNSRAGLV